MILEKKKDEECSPFFVLFLFNDLRHTALFFAAALLPRHDMLGAICQCFQQGPAFCGEGAFGACIDMAAAEQA